MSRPFRTIPECALWSFCPYLCGLCTNRLCTCSRHRCPFGAPQQRPCCPRIGKQACFRRSCMRTDTQSPSCTRRLSTPLFPPRTHRQSFRRVYPASRLRSSWPLSGFPLRRAYMQKAGPQVLQKTDGISLCWRVFCPPQGCRPHCSKTACISIYRAPPHSTAAQRPLCASFPMRCRPL